MQIDHNLHHLGSYFDTDSDELYMSIETLSYLLGISPFEINAHIIDLFSKSYFEVEEVCKEIEVNQKKKLYYKFDVYIYLIFRISRDIIGSWRDEIIKGIKNYLLKGIAVNEEMLLLEAKNNLVDELWEEKNREESYQNA